MKLTLVLWIFACCLFCAFIFTQGQQKGLDILDPKNCQRIDCQKEKRCRRTCGFCSVPPGPEEINSYQYTTTLSDVHMSLFSHIVYSFVLSLEQCMIQCSLIAKHHSACQSINFEMKEAMGSICELNNGTKESYPDMFRKRPGFIYYELSV